MSKNKIGKLPRTDHELIGFTVTDRRQLRVLGIEDDDCCVFDTWDEANKARCQRLPNGMVEKAHFWTLVTVLVCGDAYSLYPEATLRWNRLIIENVAVLKDYKPLVFEALPVVPGNIVRLKYNLPERFRSEMKAVLASCHSQRPS